MRGRGGGGVLGGTCYRYTEKVKTEVFFDIVEVLSIKALLLL